MNDIHAENARLLDETINRILKQGMVVQKGVNENGEPIMSHIDPPAAFLTAAIKRIQQVGYTRVNPNEVRDPNEHTLAFLRTKAYACNPPVKFPDLGTEQDAATG